MSQPINHPFSGVLLHRLTRLNLGQYGELLQHPVNLPFRVVTRDRSQVHVTGTYPNLCARGIT